VLGETAGRSLVSIWKWLWGLPIESGGKIAEQVAQESLQSMQQSVAELTDAVAKVTATYEQVKQQYNRKQEEFYQAERQAKLAYSKGNQEAARLAITKAISIEKILPQLSDRVTEIEAKMIAAKEKLTRERERIEAYKLYLANLKALTEMNQAMADIHKITTELALESARSQFEEAKDSIEKRSLLEKIRGDLQDNPTEKLQADIDKLVTEDEISRRFQKLLVENN
jgi:phage shock protein A